MMKRLYGAIFGLACVSSVYAGSNSVTTQFHITTTIPPVCQSSVSATDMTFGEYNPISGNPAQVYNAIIVTCSAGVEYVVALDSGVNYSGGVHRNLKSTESDGADTLHYAMYMDPSYKRLWGDGTSSHGAPYYGTGTGSAEILTIYGHMPGNQIAAVAGRSYSDTVTVTLSY